MIPTISVPTIILRQNQSMITAILITNALIHKLRLSKIMITADLITNALIHILKSSKSMITVIKIINAHTTMMSLRLKQQGNHNQYFK